MPFELNTRPVRITASVINSKSSDIEYSLIFKCYFLRKAHGTEQAPFTRVFPSGTHLPAEFTKAMRKDITHLCIRCLNRITCCLRITLMHRVFILMLMRVCLCDEATIFHIQV